VYLLTGITIKYTRNVYLIAEAFADRLHGSVAIDPELLNLCYIGHLECRSHVWCALHPMCRTRTLKPSQKPMIHTRRVEIVSYTVGITQSTGAFFICKYTSLMFDTSFKKFSSLRISPIHSPKRSLKSKSGSKYAIHFKMKRSESRSEFYRQAMKYCVRRAHAFSPVIRPRHRASP
jgi:hypothetical protein